MKKIYMIEITEKLSRMIGIEAESSEEALSIAEDLYDRDKLELNADNSGLEVSYEDESSDYTFDPDNYCLYDRNGEVE